jgi:hypothetical protein
MRAINFWNIEWPLARTGSDGVSWRSITTGNFLGFDALVAESADGVLEFAAGPVTFTLPVAEIGFQERVFDGGGLDLRVRVFRLPDENPHHRIAFSRDIALRASGDTRPRLRLTLEDGHQAWTSPIYLFGG